MYGMIFNIVQLSFLLLLPGALAHSDERDVNQRVSHLEAQMLQVSTRTVHGNVGAKTASASPPIHGENWFFNAEALFWHASEGGTDYAQIFQHTPSTSSSNSIHNRRLKFKWDWGFRAGLGTTFHHDQWDLFLNFTWFRADNSAATSLHGGKFISPLAFIPPLSASQVKIHWSLKFYTLDLNLGRFYFISPALALHPYAGLKTAWIPQHIRSSCIIFAPATGELRAKQKNDFWGIGPQIGLDGKWFLDYGFHLFASGGGSLLWGDFDIHQKTTSPTLAAQRNHFRLDTEKVVPMAQFQLGLGFETNLYHNAYRLEISARYETQYWWNQNQLPYFSAFSDKRFQRYSEDLALYGLTVDVRFDF